MLPGTAAAAILLAASIVAPARRMRTCNDARTSNQPAAGSTAAIIRSSGPSGPVCTCRARYIVGLLSVLQPARYGIPAGNQIAVNEFHPVPGGVLEEGDVYVL